nr:unnamed protein product [Callosobruchus chinensis]
MQTWSNPPWLAVSGCAVDHARALSIVHIQSATLVQILSYYSHVGTQAFSSLDHLFIRAMFSNCK